MRIIFWRHESRRDRDGEITLFAVRLLKHQVVRNLLYGRPESEIIYCVA